MVLTIGSYEKMLDLFKKNHPEYWDLAQPQVESEPVKQDPLESLRASTTEK